jgi:hypothetical protein
MQSVACLERERFRRKAASLVALVAWCGIAVTIASPACLAQEGFPPPNRFENANPVYVVDQTACVAKVDPKWHWTETEIWAWTQICLHLPVDFDEMEVTHCVEKADRDMALDTLRNTKSPPADVSWRRLSRDFPSRVFGEPLLRPHTWTEQLRFTGFNTDELVIDAALLKSLDLRHARVGRLSIQNASFDAGVRLVNVHSGSIKINFVTAKNMLLRNVVASKGNSELVPLSEFIPRGDKPDCSNVLTIGKSAGVDGSASAENPIAGPKQPNQPPSKKVERDGELLIDTVRIDDRLAILSGEYGSMNFKHVKVDDLFIFHPAWTGDGKKPDLSISESVDSGVFTLQLNSNDPPKLNSNDPPIWINLNEFIFANANLGPDPTPVLDALKVNALKVNDPKGDASKVDPMSSAKGAPNLDEPFTLIAKSYADRGEKRISDDVLIAMNKLDQETAQWGPHWARLFFFGWLVNYGFSPGRGFSYIFGCVLVGSVIFLCAKRRLVKGEYQPTNLGQTFLLAFDSVIPGIQLDKRNLDVRYDGWPQWILYLLRALGAVLVAVAYSFLQKRLFG